MSAEDLVILPSTYALPPEPPVGTVVRGREFHYVRRDFDTPRCWAAGDGPAPADLNSIHAWTWGEVLNDGPVTRVLAERADRRTT